MKNWLIGLVLKYLLPKVGDWASDKLPELKAYLHPKLRDALPDWSEDAIISMIDKVLDAGLALILSKLPDLIPLYQQVLVSTGPEGQVALVAYEDAVDKAAADVAKIC